MSTDLAEQINRLLGDFSGLAPRIRHLSINADKCGDRIGVRCSYISFRDGQQTFDDFVQVVAEHIVSFCLPRAEIAEARDAMLKGDLVEAGRQISNLDSKARGLFIKATKGSTRSGEGGELVLYILAEWLLKAPQIVSKMYLKTNNNMPVHGTDGIHARFDSIANQLYLYWGESKACATVATALSNALTSIKDFIDSGAQEREVQIVGSFTDFGDIDEASKKAFLAYLDPYSEKSNERVTVYACMLIFDWKSHPQASAKLTEEAFVAEVTGEVEAFIASVQGTVGKRGLGPHRFEFLLLPVPSVQDFRDKFQARIGWPHD